jgi:hypothetical protein
MTKKKEVWVEVAYWLRAFATPFLLFGLSAFVVLFSGKNLVSAAISLLFLGTVAGVIYAEHIRRKYGAANYFTKLNKDPDIRMTGDESETKDKNKNH